MSLNDFEYLHNLEPADAEKLIGAYELYEKAVSESETPKVHVGNLLSIREKATSNLDDLVNAATEMGWELGVLEERAAVEDILDELENSLTDDEEDAKLTIGIIRTMLRKKRKNV